MRQFGANLRFRARQLGLTDAEVARRSRISARRYGFYVTGDREPDLATLIRIAEVLDIDIDALLKDTKKKRPSDRDKLLARLATSANSLSDLYLSIVTDISEGFAARRR